MKPPNKYHENFIVGMVLAGWVGFSVSVCLSAFVVQGVLFITTYPVGALQARSLGVNRRCSVLGAVGRTVPVHIGCAQTLCPCKPVVVH